MKIKMNLVRVGSRFSCGNLCVPKRKKQSSVVYNLAFRYGKIRLAFERVLKGEILVESVKYCGGVRVKAVDFTVKVFVSRSLDISSGKLGLYKK